MVCVRLNGVNDMMPFMETGQIMGRLARWQKNLLARYNRTVASLPTLTEESREEAYQEAMQYMAVLHAIIAIRKEREPNWEDTREELEYYLDWEVGDPLWSELPVEDKEPELTIE